MQRQENSKDRQGQQVIQGQAETIWNHEESPGLELRAHGSQGTEEEAQSTEASVPLLEPLDKLGATCV